MRPTILKTNHFYHPKVCQLPYPNEYAGLESIRYIADSGMVDEFRDSIASRKPNQPLPLPEFLPCPAGGRVRGHILAIDGSAVTKDIPGALPCTEAGLVSLGVVVMNLNVLNRLERLPGSGAVNPRLLRETENTKSLGVMLPGRNAARKDGTDPRTWFRHIVNSKLEESRIPKEGESFAETLHHLFSLGDTDEGRTVRCPNPDCAEREVPLPKPYERGKCESCDEQILLSDGLRIHEEFYENAPVGGCHSRFMNTLEILALMNSLRYLSKTHEGRRALSDTAFVMDGPLAAFETIAVLSRSVRAELRTIQGQLREQFSDSSLVVLSGVKSGAFVNHAHDLDRSPEPDARILNRHYWMPDNSYIQEHIVAKVSSSPNPTPWGELTYFGRPVILKTQGGQRLVLNLAQPEADPPLTNAGTPYALADALTTANNLGVGSHEFLALQRAHNKAAIPLQTGTDLIQSLLT